ncbi:O-antigen ligase family protein [Natronococcus jeotgali]|uniref:O-antigen polymerase n=1 Tax=Natronococcus jeotgali DSM 18795 TaxID=1227498 RepID=L9X2I3_9EURY|nr:O-antigen ligase family protein [Natronococcus jeotgali]ELY55822.1 O-antigen polymerase [Natronococcus jeotgali DSM 18795]
MATETLTPERGRDYDALALAVLGILVASILPVTVWLPSAVGSAVVFLAYAGLGTALLYGVLIEGNPRANVRRWIDTIPRFALLSWVVISTLYLLQIVLGNFESITNVGSALATPVIVAINLFLIPRLLSLERFLEFVMWVSGSLVILGLPVFLLALVIDSAALTPYLWQTPLSFGFIELPRMSSVVDNPNVLGRLTFAGAIISVLFILERDTVTDRLFLGLNVLGLFLSNSMTSLIVFFVSLVLIGVYVYAGRKWFVKMLGLAAAGVLFGVAVMYFVIAPITGTTLSGRLVLWEATVQAIAQEPILGYGFGGSGGLIEPYTAEPQFQGDGTHNAYLYLTLTTGLLGGLAYMMLYFGSIVYALRRRLPSLAPLVLVFGFAIIQLMETQNVFGYTVLSVVLSITVGYLLLPSRRVQRTRTVL